MSFQLNIVRVHPETLKVLLEKEMRVWHLFAKIPRGSLGYVAAPPTDMTHILRLDCRTVWTNVLDQALGVAPELAQWEWTDSFDDLIPRILMGTEVLTYVEDDRALRYNTPEQVHRLHQGMIEAFDAAFIAASKLEYIEHFVENVRAFYEIANRNGEATMHAWV